MATEPPTAAMGSMAVADAPVAVAVATLVNSPNKKMPPGRVRAMFKKLDANADGSLTLDELTAGFEKEFDAKLTPHAKEAIPLIFDKLATPDENDVGKALKIGMFSQFYAAILFKSFDADNSGVLEIEEAREALKFLTKPDANGVQAAPIIAYPPEFTDASGEVHLPIQWFWATFSSMT